MITVWLFYFFLLLFPFGQLVKLPTGYPEINLYGHDVILVLLVLTFVLTKIFKKEKLFLPKLMPSVLFFVFSCLLSLVFNFKNWPKQNLFIGFLYLLRWGFYVFVYLFVYDLLKRKNKLKRDIQSLLIIVIFTTAVLGLMQYFFIPDIRPLTFLDWDPHYYRLVGTFLDPGFTGLIYVFGLILIILELWQEEAGKRKIFLGITLILTYLGLALTYSRSSYLAFLTVIAAISWYKKSIKFFLAVLLVGFLTIVLLPRPGGEGVRLERESTVLARIESYKRGLKVVVDHPVFGVGFNTYRYAQKKYGFLKEEWQQTHSGSGIDSSLLFVLATTGIIGLTSYLYLLLKLFFVNFPSKKTSIFRMIPFVSLLAVFVHAFFNNSLFYPWSMIWLWVVLGLNTEG